MGRIIPTAGPTWGRPRSVQSITREDAVAFYKRIMVPANAALVVVGDVQPDAIECCAGNAVPDVAARPGPSAAVPRAVTAALPETRTLYLIDKPAAAQSVLTVGKIGAARKSPDFYALTLMNAILGGQFVSRINMNLREDKGYSYGAESSFSFLRGPGPFEAECHGSDSGDQGIAGRGLQGAGRHQPAAGRSPTRELAFAKQRIIQGFPRRFETTFGVAGQLAILVADELPDDEFAHYQVANRIGHQGRRRPRRPRVHHAGEDGDPGRRRSRSDRGTAREPAVRQERSSDWIRRATPWPHPPPRNPRPPPGQVPQAAIERARIERWGFAAASETWSKVQELDVADGEFPMLKNRPLRRLSRR